jgi:hypothetical protein
MKKLLFIAAMFLSSLNSFSQKTTQVKSYYRSNGTYVESHYRTTPNYTRDDNFSTIGNINPYTGVYGTKEGGLNSSYYSSSSSYSMPCNYYSAPTFSNSYSLPTYSLPSYNSINSSLYTTPSFYSTPSYSIPNYNSINSSLYSTTKLYTYWQY